MIHQECAFREEAKQLIERELKEETFEHLRKIKKSILEPVQGVGSSYPTGNPELRKKYASMSAAELVLTVFRNAKEMFSAKKLVSLYLSKEGSLRLCGNSSSN